MQRASLRVPEHLTIAAAIVFWSICAFDFWAVFSDWRPYAAAYGEDLLAWLQGFPPVRRAAWGGSVLCGLAGAAAMIWRPVWAGDLMLSALGLIVLGLGWDLVFSNGAAHYRADGLVASAAVVVVASLLAWAAYRRATTGENEAAG